LARECQWALQQLWDLEHQSWLESLPVWQREAILDGRQRRASRVREADEPADPAVGGALSMTPSDEAEFIALWQEGLTTAAIAALSTH
jgi:hypothetical protein